MSKRTKYESINGPLKWHGGKAYLAGEIVKLFPPRCANPNSPADGDAGYVHYCEPYFGGGSVLLANDPEGISEVVGDADFFLSNFWNVLSSKDEWPQFRRTIEATQFSEHRWHLASLRLNEIKRYGAHDRDVYCAVEFFITCRQSLAGRMDAFAPRSRNRTRRGMNEQVSAWLNSIEGLAAVHSRLKRVLIVSAKAIEVIQKEDGPRTLFYLDPPYLHETRSTTGEYGEHEMTSEDHVELLNTLGAIQGRFVLSGYRSALYDQFADFCGWRRVEFDIANHAAGGKTKERKTECVWMNYKPEGVK